MGIRRLRSRLPSHGSLSRLIIQKTNEFLCGKTVQELTRVTRKLGKSKTSYERPVGLKLEKELEAAEVHHQEQIGAPVGHGQEVIT